ncbi:MAG: GNAT family N-acetyltransferase [Chloroflexia bacterium]|nr:GNAT family N-acetyltransferase [Chloroflexia bacterium]
MLVQITATDRHVLTSLFAGYRYDRVLIESVLEGHAGMAYADSAHRPTVVRLDTGAFTLLGGDPTAVGTKALLDVAPIQYVTPQNAAWQRLLQHEFGPRITVLPFTDFAARTLEPAYLARLSANIASDVELLPIDQVLAKQLLIDLDNDYFFENFHSLNDFLARGMGFCIVHDGMIVSAATSMARSNRAIDIEIKTVSAFRRRGLGTATGARLVLECLERGIEPRWLAANAVSEALALRLGYVRGERYATYAIDE